MIRKQSDLESETSTSGDPNEVAVRRGDTTFSVEKFAAFCADSAGRGLSEEEMASARRLCRDLEARQLDSDRW
jgi:hypothetical protein